MVNMSDPNDFATIEEVAAVAVSGAKDRSIYDVYRKHLADVILEKEELAVKYHRLHMEYADMMIRYDILKKKGGGE